MDHVDLHWIPTGAGTQIARNMKAYEWVAATLARRPRVILCHAALKVEMDGRTYTAELTPVTEHEDVIPAPVTGPVGARLAGRFRFFRYQLCCMECPALPDEQWTIGDPVSSRDGPGDGGARLRSRRGRAPVRLGAESARDHGDVDLELCDFVVAPARRDRGREHRPAARHPRARLACGH